MFASRRGSLIGFALAVGALLAGPAVARERDDKVLLREGDRVTAEIIRLEAGQLSVRTLAFGTVDVDWPDVVGLISVAMFEVERIDGLRIVGRLDVGEPPRGTLIVRRDGEEPVEIPLAEVAGIEQVGSRLWRGRRGHVDLGWTYAQASGESNFTLDAELALRGRHLRWINSIESTISVDEGEDRSERDVLESRLEVPIGRRFVALGWGGHERNDDLDLEARDSIGAVAAWVPVLGVNGRLVAGPGLVQSYERYFSTTEEDWVTNGVLLVAGEYHRFGRFGTRAALSLFWFPALSGEERNRYEVRAGFRQKLGSDFHFAITPYYSYDSNPPVSEAAHEDWGWTTSLGWLF